MKPANSRSGMTAPPGLLALALLLAAGSSLACDRMGDGGVTYDIVIRGGRVMDPESGLDGIRSVGIRDGRIESVAEGGLEGARVIDATGLVVAPGFVDLHEHGQTDEAYRLQAQDGVTSSFELEVGTHDVAGWYAAREGGQVVNHGVSVGHIQVRMAVMGDQGGLLPSGPGGHQPATEDDLAEMARRIQEGLDQGAVAVGFGPAYTPAATEAELERMFTVAAQNGASVHIHVRGSVEGLREAIRVAERTGAPLHVVHANSSGDTELVEFLALIDEARSGGLDITTEAYPYGAGMTSIQSALFDDWESWDEDRFGIHQWVATGERLNRESFRRAREEGGMVIIHGRTEEMTRMAITSPLTMIASDGMIENGQGHPRSSGSYSKVLGRYVRDEGALTLMDALRKMTIEPARRLESWVPDMRRKGRIRVGADADVTVFDPSTVMDRSTYESPALPPTGISFVLVNGVVVVDGGRIVEGARPGRAIRAGDPPTT